jgi:tetratricopeptide (TPR) repeat protein
MKRLRIPVSTVLLSVVFFLVAGHVRAEQPEEKARVFFEHQQYKEALAVWNEMIASGQATVGLYFNIGMTESLLQNTPGAILAYEKALRLKPMNKTVRTAILEERKKIENGTIPVNPFFLSEWYKGLVTLLRPGYWAILGLGSIAVALFGFIRYLTRKPFKPQLKRNVLIYFLAMGFCCLALGLLSYREIYRDDEAIVIEACEFMQAPADDSPHIRTLHPGEKIVIADQIGDWYNVRLLNLDIGWIKKNCLVSIQIGK